MAKHNQQAKSSALGPEGEARFTKSFEENRAMLISIARHRGASPEDAEDIVHKVFLDSMQAFNKGPVNRAYLTAATRNRTISAHRHRKMQGEHGDQGSLERYSEQHPGSVDRAGRYNRQLAENPQQTAERRELLGKVSMSVSPMQAQTLRLYALGHPVQEIARESSRTPRAVKEMLSRAQKMARIQRKQYNSGQ